MSNRDFDATDWHVATGTRDKRYPYWVTRTLDDGDGRLDRFAVLNDKGNTRKFATREAAQKVADAKQVTADFDDAREHARRAVHHLIRATDGVKPGHPALETLAKLSDLYLELTGQQM
ncbi:hypothetical protein KHO57_gp235 [Mycobacterium phage Phabba]|uniref:Uncharacterized protein n=1 Tax=Mycobacterium phage Phabba TaxID=2027899 RepID=A0A249XSF4_9CAUD|nr:hypothetical protein KHO57_gp235 [Mycobacterium phage Phabba]ASZ74669.1 hypothetical protein SEA_PHABBA_100 [Mycobacterium phage Phabba]